MDVMWEQLTESAESPAVIDGRPTFRRLKKVKYLTPEDGKPLKSAFEEFDRRNIKAYSETPVLYFTNTTLIKGLLHWGKIYNPRIYPVEPPKYFQSSLRKMPSESSSYDDVITFNPAIRGDPLSISKLYNWIYAICRQQNLFEIHQYLEEQKMDYLALSHEKEIIRLLVQNIEPSPTLEERKETIYAYLAALKTTYEADKKSWGTAGWSYTFGWSEWKK